VSRFPALGRRDFALLWGANIVSRIGTQMRDVALAWQIYLLTRSPVALGRGGPPCCALSGTRPRRRLREFGGSAQESNLPKTAELPRTDFEDRGRHQPATRFRRGC